MGPLWREMPTSRPFLYMSFRVSSKGALPPGSPRRAPIERDAAFPEPTFIRHSKSLVNEPPFRFPNGALMEREGHFQSLSLHILKGPQ